MSLKVELKPGERLIVGNCVITNSDQRTRLYLDGRVPILREKDILTAETADTPAKRVYFAVQLMYLDANAAGVRREYFNLINDLVTAAPSAVPIVAEMNNEMLTGEMYKALKVARRLINYEQELLRNAAERGAGLPPGGQTHR
jgi:flagellar biosynthesis repressor protein FlbT